MTTETIYSNVESFEGTVNGTVTETLGLYSRKIVVTNDSGSSDLKFYPKSVVVNTYITLKPTETITLDRFRSPTFSIVTTASVPYRVWVFG
jgi:hypothetical protein